MCFHNQHHHCDNCRKHHHCHCSSPRRNCHHHVLFGPFRATERKHHHRSCCHVSSRHD